MTDQANEILKTAQDYKKLFIKKSQFQQKHGREESSDEYLDLISFSLLEETYGIELMALKEILKAKGIERVPKSPNHLIGILNLRGMLVTVVDLKKRLGFVTSELSRSSRIIIVEYEKRSIGFLVDRVNEIIRLDTKSIIDPPAGINTIDRRFIKGVGKKGEGEVILPDLEKVLKME